MVESKQAPAQTTLRYLDELSSAQYEFFEIDTALLNGLEAQELIIKSYLPPAGIVTLSVDGEAPKQTTQVRSAALTSNSATYKLKKSETSNTMLITGLHSGTIYKSTSVYVELERAQTNKY
jgi:Sister chromatid cohesion protein Dcc1